MAKVKRNKKKAPVRMFGNYTERTVRMFAKTMHDSIVVTASSVMETCNVGFGKALPSSAPKDPNFENIVLGFVKEDMKCRRADWSALMVLYTIDENLDEVPETHNTSCTDVLINDFDKHMHQFYLEKSKEFVKDNPSKHVFGWGWCAVHGLVTAEEWSRTEDSFIDQFDSDAMFEQHAKHIGADIEMV